MSERRSLLGDISWFQVVAAALAAMTAAWIGSALGVAGTLVGTAVASLTLTITSAFYRQTLDHGRTLIVQTERGTTIEKRVEPGEVGEALEEAAESGPIRGAEVVEEKRSIPWRTVAVSTVIALVLALGAMGSYELVSGRSYGADPDNARIGNPFGGSSTSTPTEDVEEDEAPDPGPTSSTPAPTATTPDTPTPTRTAPTPAPTRTVSPPVDPDEPEE